MSRAFRQVAEDYLIWLKANRTERYFVRQERILREDVLSVIGETPIGQVLFDELGDIENIPTEQEKRGLAAHRAVLNVIGWYQKQLS